MIRLGNSGMHLCDRNEQPRISRRQALFLLRRCQSDPATMEALRVLARQKDGARAVTDQQVLETVAAMIESHELVLFGEAKRMLNKVGHGGSPGTRGEEEGYERLGPPNARPSSRPTASQPRREPAIFPPDIDTAVMANVIRSAAGQGMAFCDT